MPLGELPYDRLEPLVRHYLSTEEDESTAELIQRMRAAKRRGWLTRSELEAVCYWKSPRVIGHIRANTPGQIRSATRVALRTRSERLRLENLTQLKGVSVPMASAVLMLLNPKRYGVIDIRVWQLLHELGTIKQNASGVGFGFNNWYQYLMIIRYLAKKLNVTARNIERALFLAHQGESTGPVIQVDHLFDEVNHSLLSRRIWNEKERSSPDKSSSRTLRFHCLLSHSFYRLPLAF